MEKLEKETMNTEKEGWADETQAMSGSVKEFLQSGDIRNINGCEVSGGSVEISRQIGSGEVNPDRVNVLYEKGEITQVHVEYHANDGNNLDIYLTGEAIKIIDNFFEK